MIQNMLQKTTKNRAKISEQLSPNRPNVEKNRLQNARQLKIGRGGLNGGPTGPNTPPSGSDRELWTKKSSPSRAPLRAFIIIFYCLRGGERRREGVEDWLGAYTP